MIRGFKDPVMKLLSYLNGLKQGSREFKNLIDMFLKNQGFKKSRIEPCLFYKSSTSGRIFITMHVDDILIVASTIQAREETRDLILKNFNGKKLGITKEYLGIRVTQSPGEVFLDQEQYILAILEKFQMSECNPTETPCENSNDLEEDEDFTEHPIRELVGCLLFVSQSTRPDIAVAVNRLSRCVSKASNRR
jgi:hypothetical protein